MKPDPDLDLKALVEEAAKRELEARREAVISKINHILGKNRTEIGSVWQLEKALEKAKESVAKEQEKLKQLSLGNWSVLPDDKNEGRKERLKEGEKEESET